MAWGSWESGTVLTLVISIVGGLYCCFILGMRKRKDKQKDNRKNDTEK